MHPLILHPEGERTLKIAALALALWTIPAVASATDLVVGVVHDSDGYPVSGATVSLRLHGAGAGSGTTAADGTFAVDTPDGADTVAVRCTYCMPASIPHTAGKTAVLVVKRFAVLRDSGITAADARVLPYDTVGGIASLLPFTVASRSTVSDRGLAGTRGTVVADGIPLYRASDGVDLGGAVPPHGTATITQTDPTFSNSYGARSSGGLFAVDTLDIAGGIVRVDSNAGISGTLRGGNVLRGAFVSAGGVYPSTRIVGDSTFGIGTGSLDVRAVGTNAIGANGNGFATTFSQPLRASTLTALLTMNHTNDSSGPENDAIANVALQHGGISYGVRGMRSSGSLRGDAFVQFDERAYVEATHDNGYTRVFASLAAAQSGDFISNVIGTKTGALLPIASIATKVGGGFAVHADSADALLPAPLYVLYYQPYTTSVERTHVLDAGLTYDDMKRLRVDVMAFRETATGATKETLGGSGISVIWQIAPSVALRTWVMISRENTIGTPLYPAGTSTAAYPETASLYDRNTIWLTAGNVLRVDAISHGGRLDGDISFPLGSQVRFIAGTRRDGLARQITVGLQLP